jgi:hypothetical protein
MACLFPRPEPLPFPYLGKQTWSKFFSIRCVCHYASIFFIYFDLLDIGLAFKSAASANFAIPAAFYHRTQYTGDISHSRRTAAGQCVLKILAKNNSNAAGGLSGSLKKSNHPHLACRRSMANSA